MSACPLCGKAVHQSTVALDTALAKVDEYESTIVRMENRGLINFVAGMAIGFAIGGLLVLGVHRYKERDQHEPVRQVSASRTDTGR